MIARGRPIGFLAIILMGWVGTRAAILYTGPVAAPRLVPAAEAHAAIRATPAALAMAFAAPASSPSVVWQSASDPRRPHARLLTDAEIVALHGLRHYYEVPPRRAAARGMAATSFVPPTDTAGAAVASARPDRSRWSLSAWLVARPGRADPRIGPLLGASQAGARLRYAFDDDRRVAAFVRVAAPLSHGDAEVGAGLQWQPARAPVTGFVELRSRAGGVAPALGGFGGGSAALPAGFRLDGYAEAGWVGGRDASGFVDGQIRTARQVAAIGKGGVDAGIGIWGAAQRGAGRLDLGPGLGFTLPVGRGAVRLGLDWRQRIAGHAAPDSGVALTLGAGF